MDGNLGNIITQRVINETEPNGSINQASSTGIEAGEEDSILINVDFVGDFEFDENDDLIEIPDVGFFRVSSNAGQLLSILSEALDGIDTVLEVYDSNGTLIAFNDDISFPTNTNSQIDFIVPSDGEYFIAVRSFNANIGDPFDSSDNSGPNEMGNVNLSITQSFPDVNYYEVELNAGDILGAAIDGAAQNVQIFNPNGDLIFGSSDNLSSFYGSESKLVGNADDNATAGIVASEAGTYVVAVTGGSGSYDLDLNVNRPVLEGQAENSVQHFYLDFDGHTLNDSIFGGSGNNIAFDQLSDFLVNWGLSNTVANRNAVMDAIIEVFERELVSEVTASGTNDNFDIVVLNSRDHEDPSMTELPNISRLIIGGTIADTGISTIGLAENLDVGNFDTSDTGFVLLDLLSEIAGDPNSINSIVLGSGVSIIDAIGLVVGTIAAHEAGHLLGNFHTENGNSEPNVQDQGGIAIPEAFAGNDGILGTSDDPDIAFGEDAFEADEGLQGTHDTLNNISNAATTGQGNGFAYLIDEEVLSYRGGNADDTVGVSINDIESIYYTAFSNQTPFYLLNNVFNDLEQIQINAGNGNNQITIFNRDDNAPDEQDPFLINLNFTVDTVVNTGNGTDTITTSFGDDTINAGSGNDTLNGRGGADVLNGGAGVDSVTYAGSDSSVTVFTSGRDGRGGYAQGDQLTDIENITGSDHADQIVLNAAAPVDNTVNSGDGDDRIRDIDGGTNTLNGEAGEDTIIGGSGVDFLDGGEDSDLIFGGDDNDIINGGDGDFRDELFGNTGNDTINGEGGDDRLRGQSGEDTINGGTGNDNIRGGVANDMLFGDDGNDTILGDQGDDMIDGGAGNDRLFGGNNSDTFIFATDYDFDRILDFQTNRDDVDLTDFGLADFAAVQALMVQDGNRVALDFGNGDILRIENGTIGITIAQLDADNFVL